MAVLQEQFGQIDIYLFDQLLRGRIVPGMRILDAGCGAGRNLVYLLQAGYEVFGADADAASIAEVRRLAARLAPVLPAENFRVESLEALTFPSLFADTVICRRRPALALQTTLRFNAMLQGCLEGTQAKRSVLLQAGFVHRLGRSG